VYEDYAGGSAKLSLCMELIGECVRSGHRALLFSQFTSMLDILEDHLDAQGIPHMRIDGSTPPVSRLALVNAFNAGDTPLFLISLKAGGTGLNITGADIVIHFDPWWNPAVMDQASDRAHRFGQDKTVQVINIVAKDTVEEKITRLQARKRSLIDSVIQEGASYLDALSLDELKKLFAD
jgi:SNF2 family DNA or RNA helicase